MVSDQIGSPTYAIDLAELTLEAIKRESFGAGIKIYHFANRGTATWYELAKKIKEIANSDCEIKPIKTRNHSSIAKRPKYSVLSCNEIIKDFNFKIRPWELALKDCIKEIID